jgi:hypothetical protein
MKRSKIRNLIIIISLIIVFIALLSVYWAMIGFNPFKWIEENMTYFIIWFGLGIAGAFILIGFWLTHRKGL